MADSVFLQAGCRDLAAAQSADEIRRIRNYFTERQAYARERKFRDLEADCIEIRMRAGRRLHQLVKAQKQTIGIDKNLAREIRQIGRLDENEFNEAMSIMRKEVASAVRAAVPVTVPFYHFKQASPVYVYNIDQDEWFATEWFATGRLDWKRP